MKGPRALQSRAALLRLLQREGPATGHHRLPSTRRAVPLEGPAKAQGQPTPRSPRPAPSSRPAARLGGPGWPRLRTEPASTPHGEGSAHLGRAILDQRNRGARAAWGIGKACHEAPAAKHVNGAGAGDPVFSLGSGTPGSGEPPCGPRLPAGRDRRPTPLRSSRLLFTNGLPEECLLSLEARIGHAGVPALLSGYSASVSFEGFASSYAWTLFSI